MLKRYLGDLVDLAIEATITTLAIEPVAVPQQAALRLYWCYLTRVGAVTVNLGGRSFAIGEDRAVKEAAGGDLTSIQGEVTAALGQLADDEREPARGPALA